MKTLGFVATYFRGIPVCNGQTRWASLASLAQSRLQMWKRNFIMPMMRRSGWVTALILACLTPLGGCVHTGTLLHLSHKMKPAPTPTRVLLMLTPSSAESHGRHLMQGIMCRAYFFVGENPHPVLVDGDVTLAAYDRSQMEEGPKGLYVIPADRLKSHLRSDIIGDSYVFWLPYVVSDPMQVVVQAKYRAPEGDELISGMTSLEMRPIPNAAPVPDTAQAEKPQKTQAVASKQQPVKTR